MPVRAVPSYVASRQAEIAASPPGHRFRSYLSMYDPDSWQLQKGGQTPLHQAVEMSAQSGLIAGLHDRVTALSSTLGADSTLIIQGKLSAPLATGMGMEHALENGFAFLDPYGLPYLPGSSIKGVLRRAAEELALFEAENRGWSILDVFWLFGFDSDSGFYQDINGQSTPPSILQERRAWQEVYLESIQETPEGELREFLETAIADPQTRKEVSADPGMAFRVAADAGVGRPIRNAIHIRGALQFWDSIPRIHGDKLRVDVLNPHYKQYYEGIQAPGDWMNPVPIFFLAIPPLSSFTFIVRFVPPGGTPAPYAGRWKALLESAFDLAFEWLGFGAKTAVGYGRFDRDRDAEQKRESQRLEQIERARAEALAREEAEKEQLRELRRLEEAEREKERLDRLSPAGRLAEELRKGTTPLARAQEIQNSELAKFTGEDLRVVALALKEAYERHGKWSGGLNDKQKTKVQKLREILGG